MTVAPEPLVQGRGPLVAARSWSPVTREPRPAWNTLRRWGEKVNAIEEPVDGGVRDHQRSKRGCPYPGDAVIDGAKQRRLPIFLRDTFASVLQCKQPANGYRNQHNRQKPEIDREPYR